MRARHTQVAAPPTPPSGVRAAFEVHGVARRLHRGTRLFRAGDPVPGLHLVIGGHLRILREGSRPMVVHHEGPGGMLGETALFGGTTYPATAVATEPTTCRLLPVAQLAVLLRDDPEAAAFFLGRLAGRLLRVIDRLDALGRLTVAVRLAAHLGDRPGARSGGPISLGMTQQEMAEELGTVREVVVRELRRLVRRGVLCPAGRGLYRVVDPGGLAMIAGH